MSTELTLGVKLAGKLQDALERNSVPDLADLDWLASGDNIAKMRRVRLGHAEIVTPEHIIDCDADPFVPDGWSVEEHKRGGMVKFDPANLELYLDRRQKGGVVGGDKLRKALAKKSVLNANMLDYLLEHPHLIPEEWEGKCVFFWGTIYHHRDGDLCVRYLFRHGRECSWHFRWLDDVWGDGSPALLLASRALFFRFLCTCT